MYENRKQPPLARNHFRRRMMLHGAIALGLIAVSLGMGMAGYCVFEHLAPLDGFLNAAMLLGGMGPVNPPRDRCGQTVRGCIRAVRRSRVHRHRGPVVHAAAASADAPVPLGRQVIATPPGV